MYSSGQSYYVFAEDLCREQGDLLGTMHPNTAGNKITARLIARRLDRALDELPPAWPKRDAEPAGPARRFDPEDATRPTSGWKPPPSDPMKRTDRPDEAKFIRDEDEGGFWLPIAAGEVVSPDALTRCPERRSAVRRASSREL